MAYKKQQVRTTEINGEVWFVAKDICDILEIVDYHQAVESLDDDEKGVGYSIPTPGGIQSMTVISEPGIYALVMKSRKPEAKQFSRWVRHDVLPAIRKTGMYSVNKKSQDTFAVDAAVRIFELAGITGNQLVLAADKVYKRGTGFSALLAGDIQLEAPVKEQALTPTEIAEALGIGKGRKGGRRVNEILCYAKFQRKIGKNWEPLPDGRDYAVVLDTNKKRSDGTPVRQIKWNSSVIPVIEQFLPVRTQ